MAKFFRIILVVFICSSFSMQAQTGPIFTQYMFNKMLYNPAATGLDTGYISAKGFYQDEWLSYRDPYDNGAPTNWSGSVDAAIGFKKAASKRFYLGLGLSYSNATVGFLTQNQYLISASCHYLPSFGGDLSLGINSGATNMILKPGWIIPIPIDPYLPDPIQSKNGFDGGAGLYYSTKNYYIGFSALNIINTKIQWNQYSYSEIPVISTLTAGYNIEINHNKNLVLQPSFLLVSHSYYNAFDASCLFLYRQRFWGGLDLKYDANTTGGIMAGVKVVKSKYGDLSLGGACDIEERSAAFFGDTLELMLNARVKI